MLQYSKRRGAHPLGGLSFDIDFYLFFFIYASAQNYVCHIENDFDTPVLGDLGPTPLRFTPDFDCEEKKLGGKFPRPEKKFRLCGVS